jgi:S1-C subfamily serine protease
MQYRKSLISAVIIAFFISFGFAMGPKKETKVNTVVVKKGEGYRLGAVIKNTKENNGAKIVTLFKNSEAEKIGLKKGDIIVKFDGAKIKDAKQLSALVQKIEDGKKVQIDVLSAGKKKNFKATIKKVDDDSAKVISVNVNNMLDDEDMELTVVNENAGEGNNIEKIFTVSSDKASKFMVWNDDGNKGGYLGVNVEELSEQLREYFEVKNGVLIKDVIKDSPAEKAGLKAGDVIYKINEKNIEDYADLIRTLNYYDPGDKITVYYSRKGKTSKKSVELSEKKNAQSYTYTFDIDSDDDLRELKEKVDKTVKATVIVNGQDISNFTEEIDVEFYII